MDLSTSLARFEAALTSQLALVGGDEAFGASAQALYAALEPAIRQLGLDLAQQAATEVAAQLPDREVDVTLVEGEPLLRVRTTTGPVTPPPGDDLDARLTLRLPEALKRLVEEEADGLGDSVNSFVVKTLASHARRAASRTPAGPTSGEFET